MAAKIQRDKELEDERVLRVGRREITKQTAGSCPVMGIEDPDHRRSPESDSVAERLDGKGYTPIGDHVQDCAEL